MTALRESLAASCFILCLCAAPARADDSSPWVDDASSSLRLIAGSAAKGTDRAGVEIKLKPGWHTYWRYPGDSGVPPHFTFDGSDNVAAVTVLYPAPTAHTDETGTTLGYTEDVVFPVHVVPRQSGKPVRLHLNAEYAVCEKMCVPVEAKTDITLPNGSAATDAALSAAEARVPQQVSAASIGLTVHRVDDGKKPAAVVEFSASGADKPQVFVEGPTPDWALPIPTAAPGAPAGHQRFRFDLDGLPPGVSAKNPMALTFTIVGSGRPLEVKTRLD